MIEMKMGRIRTRIHGFCRYSVWVWALVLTPSIGAFAAEAPHHLGGFVLGGQIEAYKDLVDMDTSMGVRYLESVQEVEIRGIPGIKSGIVAFGTCVEYGRILRIKLKYTDDSLGFFNEMMKRLRARFGDPDEYRGDPFHVVVAWKWSFKDAQGNRISLIIQHNTKDEDEKMGNAIKLTLSTQLEKEQACYEAKHPGHKTNKGDRKQPGNSVEDWKHFVPY
jgi:hypothetical protein